MVRPNAPAYDEDFVAWLEDQARHARRGETEALDLDNIAEELEGMARSDRNENPQPADCARRPLAKMFGAAGETLVEPACHHCRAALSDSRALGGQPEPARLPRTNP